MAGEWGVVPTPTTSVDKLGSLSHLWYASTITTNSLKGATK